MKVKYAINVDEICDVAYNGLEAVEAVEKDYTMNKERGRNYTSYKLILMDCQMPFMDGYEATQRIKNYLFGEGAKQPIVSAVTGHTE